jgi:hypothetical protein
MAQYSSGAILESLPSHAPISIAEDGVAWLVCRTRNIRRSDRYMPSQSVDDRKATQGAGLDTPCLTIVVSAKMGWEKLLHGERPSLGY